MPKKTDKPGGKKRPVIDHVMVGYQAFQVVDARLQDRLREANLGDDAEEVIACLLDSPRFKRHLCAAAEREVEAQRKALEEAERKMREACHIGSKP